MTFEKLTSTVPEFTHVIHVADIHVRLRKRHEEFRAVFKKFYNEVADSPKTSIVCVLGDVCHSKSDLTPECVQMVSEFLWNLANLREVILVPGNHDATLSNKTRLDSLSPIVDALAHPKIHYLKESKLYGIGNILFNNMCIFDAPEKYIKGIDIPAIYRNEYKHILALFHGPVDRSVTDTGFAISNPAIMPPLFDWHDIALLGDIHRKQNIQEEVMEEHKPCIHYPGSMIQQNHGEPLHPHGYTVWDLATHAYQYKELQNEYGYFTVDLHGAQILTDLKDLPKKTYLRVRCLDTISTEVKAAEAMISTLTEILEPSRIRIESEKDKKAREAMVCKDIKLSEIADIDYQAKLIKEFLQTKLNLQDQTKIDKILLINRDLNTEIKKDDFARNLKWTPVRFEWDNMFAYGEGNVINFDKMHGVYGVFGPNTCGKSSIFSALCFCLFDKWERGFKAIIARNVAKESFRCKFEFMIGDVHYFIEKIGEGTRNGNVRVQVNFWRILNGVNEDLTDVMRRKTNDVIRDYVGTYEDFILTTLSVQTITKNNINFIDLGNTDRKDLLVPLLGLNVFDRLYDEAYSRNKDLAAKLKPHKEKNYVLELDNAESSLASSETTIKECQDAIDDVSRQIREVNNSIVAETGKLIKLDNDVPTDITMIEAKRNSSYVTLSEKEEQMKKDREVLSGRKSTLDKLTEELSEIIADDLVKAHNTYKDFQTKHFEQKRAIELKKLQITTKTEKIKQLGEYKFNFNCGDCLFNMNVKDKDAKKTKQELDDEQKELIVAEDTLKTLAGQIEEWNWVDVAYQNYTKKLNEHSKAKDEFSTLNTKILLAEKDIEKISQNLKETERKIDLYHKNSVSVENNQKVNMIILSYKNALNTLESTLHSKNKMLLTTSGYKEVVKKQIQTLTETITDIIDTEEKRELYEYYCKVVGRNGIPYQVICNVIPELTREINSILTQTTEFTVDVEADEKNIIPYVNYETKGRWPIEMTSGFERFVTSVAIRVALSNVSNLPRTNFLVLDEGFGTLDAHNLPSMYTLFTYLKSHFDFIMIVSHLDTLKDMVDKQIEISQIGNFSKVSFE
jgi:DNA repair exonuclease SbcCD ATPase subunit